MPKNKKDPSESALSGTTAREEEAASTMKAMQYLSNLAAAQSAPIGRGWNIPAGYEDWHVVDLDFSVERHKMTYYQLLQMGYKECPPDFRRYGVTHTPTKKYLMCPPAVKKIQERIRMDKLKKVASSLKNELATQNSSINALVGRESSAEIIHHTGGEDTLNNIQSEVKKTRA
jgi:hypothetical protein